MKNILEFILVVIIIFFVWNILKRMFFKTFYQFPFNNNNSKNTNPQPKDKIKSEKGGLNWDAETIDYEEVKEEKNKN